MNETVSPAKSIEGVITLPGDKSISHRYGMLGGIAQGVTTIHNYSTGADCQSTLGCMAALGARGVRGAILTGIVVTALLGVPFGLTTLHGVVALPPSLAETIPHLPKRDGSFAVVCSGVSCRPPAETVEKLEQQLN